MEDETKTKTFTIRMNEYAGTSSDPYLELNYTNCPIAPIVNITYPSDQNYTKIHEDESTCNYTLPLNWTVWVNHPLQNLSAAWYILDNNPARDLNYTQTHSNYTCKSSAGFTADACQSTVLGSNEWYGWYCTWEGEHEEEFFGTLTMACDDNDCACEPGKASCINNNCIEFVNTTININKGYHNVTVCVNDTKKFTNCETTNFGIFPYTSYVPSVNLTFLLAGFFFCFILLF
jgi:hypothetical protein